MVGAVIQQLVHAVVDLHKGPVHPLQKNPPCLVQVELALLPVEQGRPQGLLQPGDALAQGGLGDVELPRRLGHVLQPGHRAKILQLCQIHATLSFSQSVCPSLHSRQSRVWRFS